MGLNMPAKTVIFTQVKKFDGTESRWITSGEYIQMSGRAGRRGKDDKGLVIMMMDESLDIETCRWGSLAPEWPLLTLNTQPPEVQHGVASVHDNNLLVDWQDAQDPDLWPWTSCHPWCRQS